MVVGVGLVAVVLAIILIVVQLVGGGDETPTPSASGTTSESPDATSESPSSTPSETPDAEPTTASGNGTTCLPNAIQVTAITDRDVYGPTEQPQVSLSITNVGSVACDVAAGSDVQEYVVTSGADRIWSSRDCQMNPVADVRTIEPGQTLSTAPFAWDRTRSSADTCDQQRSAVSGGGASYHLEVTIGDFTSTETKQFILN